MTKHTADDDLDRLVLSVIYADDDPTFTPAGSTREYWLPSSCCSSLIAETVLFADDSIHYRCVGCWSELGIDPTGRLITI